MELSPAATGTSRRATPETVRILFDMLESGWRIGSSQIPAIWMEDRHFLLRLLEHVRVAHLPISMRCDREVALVGVSKNHLLLSQLSEELRDDEEIASLAVGNHVTQIGFVSARLRDDDEFVATLFQTIPSEWDKRYMLSQCSDRLMHIYLARQESGYYIKG